MNGPTVQASEPTGYQATAAELRRIADAIEDLELTREVPYVTISFLPGAHDATDEQKIADVDRVASAILGCAGQHVKHGRNSWYHLVQAERAGVQISVQESITAPPDERDAELARLRTEVAELRGKTPDASGFGYSRADDNGPAEDMTLTQPGRIEPHNGGMTEGGLVDETSIDPDSSMEAHYDAETDRARRTWPTERELKPWESLAPQSDRIAESMVPAAVTLTASGLTEAADQSRGPLAGTTPVVTYFSFGHGQTDPDTGKSLLDHYVTVVAPTYEACREAMFASRFGREWSFDYLAGTAKATHWIPRWNEHEVIAAPGLTPAEADQALAAALNVLDT